MELATRLSLYLWRSLPDQTLMDAANNGHLKTPSDVATQAHADAGRRQGQSGPVRLRRPVAGHREHERGHQGHAVHEVDLQRGSRPAHRDADHVHAVGVDQERLQDLADLADLVHQREPGQFLRGHGGQPELRHGDHRQQRGNPRYGHFDPGQRAGHVTRTRRCRRPPSAGGWSASRSCARRCRTRRPRSTACRIPPPPLRSEKWHHRATRTSQHVSANRRLQRLPSVHGLAGLRVRPVRRDRRIPDRWRTADQVDSSGKFVAVPEQHERTCPGRSAEPATS